MEFFKKLFITFRTLITYPLWAVISLFFLLLTFPLVLLPDSYRYDNRLFFRITSFWNWLLFRVAGIRVVVKGRNRLPVYPEQPRVFVMNHASALDIFVVEQVLQGYPRVWMSKMAYKHVPLFATLLRRMHVLVDVSSVRAAARALAKMVSLGRNKKRHVLIFPEGGRFTDGKIRRFYGGFVVLARKLDRPVVPIYIRNAHHILNPTGYLIDNAVPLEIEVGPAFELQPNETDAAFSDRVRAWFCEKADAPR